VGFPFDASTRGLDLAWFGHTTAALVTEVARKQKRSQKIELPAGE